MKCLRMIFVAGFVFGLLKGPLVFAQEPTDYLVDLQDLRDPFAPQLPLPKVEPPSVAKPVVPAVPVQRQPGTAVQQPKPAAQNPSFAAAPTVGVDVESLVVKGVVWNTSTPQAIINDQVFKVGDKVKGMKIVSIGPKGIEVSNSGVKVRINVPDKRK